MTPATLPELAALLNIDEHELELALLDSQRRGLVRRDASGRWALTPATEARYGAALRAIGPAAAGDDEDGGHPALPHPLTRPANPNSREILGGGIR